jgi:hypothetical protein
LGDEAEFVSLESLVILQQGCACYGALKMMIEPVEGVLGLNCAAAVVGSFWCDCLCGKVVVGNVVQGVLFSVSLQCLQEPEFYDLSPYWWICGGDVHDMAEPE